VGRLQDPTQSEVDPAEESRHAATPAEEMATERANTYYAESPAADPAAPPPPPPAPPRQVGPNDTEVIEDVYEEPPR
jgi:hypothetical protein